MTLKKVVLTPGVLLTLLGLTITSNLVHAAGEQNAHQHEPVTTGKEVSSRSVQHDPSQHNAATDHKNVPASAMDPKAELRYSQGAIGKILREYTLTSASGKPVAISSLRGKPLVISMIYTSCYHICPTTTKHLASVVKKANEAFGIDSFNVLTIGFDTHNDTPDAMRVFAAQQGVDIDNWQFLSTDKETVRLLSEDLGFHFYPSPNGFDHLIQATVIDGTGKVYRQVYDMNFQTQLLTEPLKELLSNSPREGTLITHIGDKIRLFCTVYDPVNDRYYVDYSIFIGMIIGFSSLGVVGFVLVREWRRQKIGAA